ncbi:MAG: heme-binding protein [Syntrophomonadaceae bacterium]|nr:heme-binding protein [Syntrophomonadaceae bacterium]
MSRYETPAYQVLEKDGDIELRRYETYYTAGVEQDGLSDDSGFRQVFDFISGNNVSHEKIAMTIPVINELKPGNTSTEFVMPHKYSFENIPRPNNPRIVLKKIEGTLTAAIAFSGTVHEKEVRHYEEILTEWLARKNLKPSGAFKLARYNSPFSLPLLRRNELLIDIEI